MRLTTITPRSTTQVVSYREPGVQDRLRLHKPRLLVLRFLRISVEHVRVEIVKPLRRVWNACETPPKLLKDRLAMWHRSRVSSDILVRLTPWVT